MGKKLYVGNLTFGVTDSDLVKLFEAHGTVVIATASTAGVDILDVSGSMAEQDFLLNGRPARRVLAAC